MSPDLELIRASISALRGDETIASLVGTRIYDRPPQTKPAVLMPYISVGPTSAVPDDADCSVGEEITIQFDVWSSGADEAYSSAECRRISDAVKRVLHDAELVLDENALVAMTMNLKQILRDPDGVTSHGVIQFTATVETP